jgi:hypothetical protein
LVRQKDTSSGDRARIVANDILHAARELQIRTGFGAEL